MSEGIHDVIQNISETVLCTILITGGIAVGFYGAKLHKTTLFLFGFIAGSLFVYFVLGNIGIDSESSFLHYSLPIAFGVGICIGCLTIWLQKLSLFIIGAIVGIIVAQSLWHLTASVISDIEYPEVFNIVSIIMFAVLFGYISYKWLISAIKPVTSFIGSYMITSGSAYFIQQYIIQKDGDNILDITQFFDATNECNAECGVFLGVCVLLFIICLLYQVYGIRRCTPTKHTRLPDIDYIEGVDDNPRESEVEEILLDDV